MDIVNAGTTCSLWDAVGAKSISDVVPQMEKEGWTPIAVKHGGLSCVVMSKDKQIVKLFARNNVIGMVNTVKQ